MAHDVFISYASENRAIANAVCALLERKGLRCWIAPRDILPGVNYGEALIEAISGAHVLVLVFSSHANQSPQVMREVERAVSRGLPIVPFRIEDVPPSKAMEFFISAPHWLDALTPPMERHIERLADTVRVLLDPANAPIVRPAAPAPPKKTPRTAVFALVLLLLVGSGLSYRMLFPPSPGTIADTQVKNAGVVTSRPSDLASGKRRPEQLASTPSDSGANSPVTLLEQGKDDSGRNPTSEPALARENSKPTPEKKFNEPPPAVDPETEQKNNRTTSPDRPAREMERGEGNPPKSVDSPAVDVPPALGAAFFDVGLAQGQMQQPHTADLADILLVIDHRTAEQIDGRFFNLAVSNDPATVRGVVRGAQLEFDAREGRYTITAEGAQATGTCAARDGGLNFTLARSAAGSELLEPGTLWSGQREVWQDPDADAVTLVVDWRSGEALKGRFFAPARGIAAQSVTGLVVGGTILLQAPDRTRYVAQLSDRAISGRWSRPNRQFGNFLVAFNAARANTVQGDSVWIGNRRSAKEDGDLLVVIGSRKDEEITGRLFVPLDEGNRALNFTGHVIADRIMLETHNHIILDGIATETEFHGIWRHANDPVGEFALGLLPEQAAWLTTGIVMKGEIEMPRKAERSDLTLRIEKREGGNISGRLTNGLRNGNAIEFQGEVIGDRVLITTRTHELYFGTASGSQFMGRWKPANQKETLAFVLTAE